MGKATAPTKTGATVTIACKLPNGLVLRVFDFEEGQEPVMGGGMRTVKVAVQKGDTLRINGSAVAFGTIPSYKIVGGYALTPGIPKDFWELYEQQNHDQAFIKNHLVFAYDKFVMAEGAAEEHAGTKSGLQPIQINRQGQVEDPRAGRKIQTEEGHLKTMAGIQARQEEAAEQIADA